VGRIRASRGVAGMNYKTFRLNDGVLYAMTSAICVLESIIYVKNNKDSDYFALYFNTKTGEMRCYKNTVVVNKAFPIGFNNTQDTWYSLVFYYDCAKREVFVWL